MAQFADLHEFFDPGLTLPVGGRGYRIESPSAADGLRLHLALLVEGITLDTDEEVGEIRALLGPVLQEMDAAGRSWREIMHCGRTALLHYAVSPETAVKYWRHGDVSGNPLPPDPRQDPGASPTCPCPAPTDRTTPAAASSCPSTE